MKTQYALPKVHHFVTAVEHPGRNESYRGIEWWRLANTIAEHCFDNVRTETRFREYEEKVLAHVPDALKSTTD